MPPIEYQIVYVSVDGQVKTDTIVVSPDQDACREASLEHPEGGTILLDGIEVGIIPNVLSECGE